jgi:hypothetical protein
MENQTNPLKAYFRKPGIWIKLPSQGKFYETTPTDLNDMGEIPVFPMTAKDELMLKNADALLNGSAITQLIKSCVPSIDDPTLMPAVDLDSLLVAIKRCTYGPNVDVTTTCECGEGSKTEVSIDLNHIIASIKVINNIEPVILDNDIKVFIKPVRVKDLLEINWVQYEQIRNLQIAEQNDVDEKTKINIIQKSYQILTEKNIDVVSVCIDTVLLPDGTAVTDQQNIKEWVIDLSKSDFNKLETGIMVTSSKGIEKEFEVECSKCGKTYKAGLDLNPTTFFA